MLSAVDLPVMPPVKPMLCKPAARLPEGDGWLYEPKWDGFRCIVFRDGDEVVLGSRNERPLTRYFPEILEPLRQSLPPRCVVDGELVVPRPGAGLDFDALQQRIHPADSRVQLLARTTPSAYVAFDLLALDDESLISTPLGERRQLLEQALAGAGPPVHLTPASLDRAQAEEWFHRFEGAGLDGVIAKRVDGRYTPDQRTLVKVKHRRTADCVVAGYRVHKDGQGVGSLLLGLWNDEGRLQHVGVSASFTAKFRTELRALLAPLEDDAVTEHPWREWAEMAAHSNDRMPGGFSRWNANKDLSWVAVRPELVCEVEFDQMQGDRFRRVATFLHWRADRDPASCTYDQLEVTAPVELAEVFGRP
ncbi:MAG TPA: ATP-dependent DNA ligase [Acidimicrobiales bacterium]